MLSENSRLFTHFSGDNNPTEFSYQKCRLYGWAVQASRHRACNCVFHWFLWKAQGFLHCSGKKTPSCARNSIKQTNCRPYMAGQCKLGDIGPAIVCVFMVCLENSRNKQKNAGPTAGQKMLWFLFFWNTRKNEKKTSFKKSRPYGCAVRACRACNVVCFIVFIGKPGFLHCSGKKHRDFQKSNTAGPVAGQSKLRHIGPAMLFLFFPSDNSRSSTLFQKNIKLKLSKQKRGAGPMVQA